MTTVLQSSYAFAESLANALLANTDKTKQVLWPAAARATLEPVFLSSVQAEFENYLRAAFPEGSFTQSLALAAWMKIATEQQMMAYGLATNDEELGRMMTELLGSRKSLSEIESREDFMSLISPMRGVVLANYNAQRKFENVLASSLTPQVLPLAKPQLWREAIELIASEDFLGSFLAAMETANIRPVSREQLEQIIDDSANLRGIMTHECSEVWSAMVEETNSSTEKRREQFVLASAHHTALALPEVLNRLSRARPEVGAWLDFATSNALVSSDMFAIEFADFEKQAQLGALRDTKVASLSWSVDVDEIEDAADPRFGLALHILSLRGARFVFGETGTAAAQQSIAGGVPFSTHWMWAGLESLFRKAWKAFDIASYPITWIEVMKGAALSKNVSQAALLRNRLTKAIADDVRGFIAAVNEAQMKLDEASLSKEVELVFSNLPRWSNDIVCHDADVQLASSSDAKSFARDTTISFRTTRPVGSTVLPSGAISIFDEVMIVRDNYQGGRIVGTDSVSVLDGLAREMLKPFACTESELSFKTAPLARVSKALSMLRAGSLPKDGAIEELTFFEVFPEAQRSTRNDFAVQAVRNLDRLIYVETASQNIKFKGTCVSVAGSGLTWGRVEVANSLTIGMLSQVFAKLLPSVVDRVVGSALLQRPRIVAPADVTIGVKTADASYARRMAAEATSFTPVEIDLPLVCTLASSVVVPKRLQDLVRGLAFEQLRRYDVSLHVGAKVSLDAIATATSQFIKESTTSETAKMLKALFTKSLTPKDYAYLHDPYKRSALEAAMSVIAEMLGTVNASPVLAYYLALRVVEGL